MHFIHQDFPFVLEGDEIWEAFALERFPLFLAWDGLR
jgi:hypothetical protein